jgi:hypothetical protein
MLGAWFMATDYVTSPITKKGKIVYGICLGLVTGLLRLIAKDTAAPDPHEGHVGTRLYLTANSSKLDTPYFSLFLRTATASCSNSKSLSDKLKTRSVNEFSTDIMTSPLT